MRWLLPLAPHDDELLSSFLVRSAHRHGLSPYRFCAFHFPGAQVWNRDIDRSASDGLIAAIATKAGLATERVAQMTLGSAETRSRSKASGVEPWINTVGIYHRLRRRWGLQYCPDCLEERPILCKGWRMSFMVVCGRHRRLLQDACPHCDAPLAIHRQMLSAQLCHHCSRVLGRTLQEPPLRIDTLIQAQSYFEGALRGGSVEIAGQPVCGKDLFHGARVLASLLAPPSCPPHGPSRDHRLSLEQARVQARAGIVCRLTDVLAVWPLSFTKIASDQHLTQRSFIRTSLPTWLSTAVDELPSGRARQATASKKRYFLRAKLEQDRRRYADWRTRRAALLWQAASK